MELASSNGYPGEFRPNCVSFGVVTIDHKESGDQAILGDDSTTVNQVLSGKAVVLHSVGAIEDVCCELFDGRMKIFEKELIGLAVSVT